MIPAAGPSPYLLSGLLSCGRCGANYQGRTTNSTKHRKDGSKIKTLYYTCGSYIMRGKATCEKFVLRKDPLEKMILEVIQERLQLLLEGDGERLLRQYIDEEIGAQGADPRRDMVEVRARIEEIDRKAAALLEGMSHETRGFVDSKLRDFAAEKKRLQRRLEELQAAPYKPIDPDAVLRDGLASLSDLPRLLDSGNLEERKGFIRAFIDGVTIVPDKLRLDLRVRTFPVFGAANSSVGLVAGARYEPVQKNLEPAERFLAGTRELWRVACPLRGTSRAARPWPREDRVLFETIAGCGGW